MWTLRRRTWAHPMRHVLLVLVVIGLMASQSGMASQDAPVLEAAIGALNWGREKPLGTALVIVTRPGLDAPFPIARGFTLYGPPAWNNGRPVGLSARWPQIVEISSKYHVWWYLWPDMPPVAGDYAVEAALGGQMMRRTVRLSDVTPLPLPISISVIRIRQEEVEASWSPVLGAVSYGAMVGSSHTTFKPLDFRGLPYNTTYTTKTSGTIQRTVFSTFINRVEVYAFNVDITRVPPQLPRQFNVSWAVSDPFDFPSSAPVLPRPTPPVPADPLPPSPPP